MSLTANSKIWISLSTLIILFILLLLGTTVGGCTSPQGTLGSSGLPSGTTKPETKIPVSITWLGHTAFKLICGTKNVLIDPWIVGNPQCPISLEGAYPADIILISDIDKEHVGDSVAIAKKTGAKVVTTPQIATKLLADELPPENIVYEGSGINIGGEIEIEEIRIVMIEAAHLSQTSSPVGYIITFPGGATIYYAGDTGIFANMQLYGELYPIHLALLPIGGIVTMNAYQAVKSIQLLKPTIVIPMRFGTYPNLAKDAGEFVKLAQQVVPEVKIEVLKPGQSYILKPTMF